MHTLETKLGYVFHRPELLENALYHSSYANEHRGAGIGSNERLEFLGDAVLGFVTAEYLYTKHPDMPEGDLTRIRAALVCEESLHEVANPENLMLSDEIRAEVAATLAGLPEDLRTAITLREIEGLSYEEIAEVMECPVGTVRSRIFRAREAIDKRIQPLLQR